MSVIVEEKEDGNHTLSYDSFWNNGGGMSVNREALPIRHEEHLYNYIKRELLRQGGKYKPEDFGIEHPYVEEFGNKTRSELIEEIVELRMALESKLMWS